MSNIITTDAQYEEFKREVQKDNIMGNEKIWNFLIAHILTNNPNYLYKFCEDGIDLNNKINIWYESEPIPPKKREGNTKLDLAFGAIKKREGTQLGIEYDTDNEISWVCFIESKLLSDCSTTVSYDLKRNQIIRVIENLLGFQKAGIFPERLYFTLLILFYIIYVVNLSSIILSEMDHLIDHTLIFLFLTHLKF